MVCEAVVRTVPSPLHHHCSSHSVAAGKKQTDGVNRPKKELPARRLFNGQNKLPQSEYRSIINHKRKERPKKNKKKESGRALKAASAPNRTANTVDRRGSSGLVRPIITATPTCVLRTCLGGHGQKIIPDAQPSNHQCQGHCRTIIRVMN